MGESISGFAGFSQGRLVWKVDVLESFSEIEDGLPLNRRSNRLASQADITNK
jgi:hypothetical protein